MGSGAVHEVSRFLRHGLPALLGLALSEGCSPRAMPAVTDDAPPSVRVSAPEGGARISSTEPVIEIRYADDRSGVQAVSFRVLINGRDYSTEFDHHSDGASGTIPASRRLPLGENVITVELADRAGNRGRAESRFINAAGGWLKVTAAPGAEPPRNVELVLDASGSMREMLGFATRMEVAKQAVRGLVETVPAGTPLGLRVFRDCEDIVSLVPIRPLDPAGFLAKVDSIEPSGGTPIVASLLQSFESLGRARDGQRVAVLVTDGGESCRGSMDDVVAGARDAATRIVVIGFDIEDRGITDELRRLALSTDGAFYDARDPAQLREALERSVLRLGYVVVDGQGNVVREADVGGPPIELPPGSYQVRLRTVPQLTVDAVRVGELTETGVEMQRDAAGVKAEVRGPVPAMGRNQEERR